MMKTRCACCGQPMDTIEQVWDHKSPPKISYYVTCHNDQCLWQGYTVYRDTYSFKSMVERGYGDPGQHSDKTQ